MDTLTRIKTLENELIHGKGKTIYELADMLGRTHSYLCRISSLTEELPFPIELALKAMKIKKNYNLLKYIAMDCGFALVKLPKPANSKKDENDIAADYQKAVSEAVTAVLRFFEQPTAENHAIVSKKLLDATSEGLSVKKYCDKKADNQLELGL